MEPHASKRTQPELITFIALRRAVGILGITFPFIMVIGSIICTGCLEIQSSISAYYHTNMQNIFVGILCVIAFFLISYRGYDIADDIAGNLAGVFALGAAFFPTSVKDHLTGCIPDTIDNHIIGIIHNVSSAGFLIVLACFSFFLFTIKNKNETNIMKDRRNTLYRVTGILMSLCIILCIVLVYSNSDFSQSLKKHNMIFWLESVAICAFGVSWFIKGRTILVDKEE